MHSPISEYLKEALVMDIICRIIDGDKRIETLRSDILKEKDNWYNIVNTFSVQTIYDVERTHNEESESENEDPVNR